MSMALQILNKLTKIGKTALIFGKAHMPAILTGLGVASLVSAVPLAIVGTVKIDDELEERGCYTKEEKHDELDYKLIAKHYWPAATATVLGGACVIFGLTDQMKRTQAIVSALAMKTDELENLHKAIEENASEPKRKKILADADKKQAVQHMKQTDHVETVVEGGVYFIDMWSGSVFQSSFEKIRVAFSDFAYDCMSSDGTECVNQLRYRLGLKPIDIGECMYFNITEEGHSVEPVFGEPFEEEGHDCVPMRYSITPYQGAWS